MDSETQGHSLPSLEPPPKLRIHLDDLSHPATASFLSLVDGARILPNCINHVLRHLYKPGHNPKVPPVRSVTLVLRPMGGVAYTAGLPIDNLHKEIHLSLDHLQRFEKEPLRCRNEIIGVVTHEMVHAFQYDCQGSAPGGLIEGIADFVRLRSGLAPPHWKSPKEEIGENWDSGYQKTAYFLDWLDSTYGKGTIVRMNQTMKDCKYEETKFWPDIFGEGCSVDSLWKSYRDSFKDADSESVASTNTSEPVIVEHEDLEGEAS